MSRPPREFLVLYDIASPERQARVRKVVRAWGDRLQYSVYRCVLSERQCATLVDQLCELLNHAEDQVAFVDLGSVEGVRGVAVRTLGRPPAELDRSARIV